MTIKFVCGDHEILWQYSEITCEELRCCFPDSKCLILIQNSTKQAIRSKDGTFSLTKGEVYMIPIPSQNNGIMPPQNAQLQIALQTLHNQVEKVQFQLSELERNVFKTKEKTETIKETNSDIGFDSDDGNSTIYEPAEPMEHTVHNVTIPSEHESILQVNYMNEESFPLNSKVTPKEYIKAQHNTSTSELSVRNFTNPRSLTSVGFIRVKTRFKSVDIL